MNCFKLRSCGKCRGDLALDEGDWLCLQCGTYYYTGLYPGAWVGERPILPKGEGWARQGASISDTLRLSSTRALEA